MNRLFLAAAATMLAAITASPSLAQEQSVIPQSGTPQPAAPPPPMHSDQPASEDTLAVAQVKLVNGLRASKVIGATVYNDNNERIGSVDDLILSQNDKAVMAVVQVGGFLGAGGKLVAVPYTQLQMHGDNKVVLTGATKESLSGMPSFSYGG